LHYSFSKESVSSVQKKGEAFSSSWCQNEYQLAMGFHNFSREEKKQFQYLWGAIVPERHTNTPSKDKVILFFVCT